MPGKRKFRILAIDGGGLRGVVPLQVIRYIESLTKEEIHKSFDLIAGTSTGGLLASALTLEDDETVIANVRKYSLDQIEEIYLTKGKEIFPPSKTYVGRKIKDFQKWFSPMFNPDNLDKVLKEYLKDFRIMNCLKPIFIASYDIHRNRPIIFTSRDASLFPQKNSKLIEICRATSAAPTYFPTYRFSYDSEGLICIDGGIYMNNPSLGALVEVLGNSDYKNYKLTDKPLQLDDITVLSLGTGFTNTLIDGEKSRKWGRIKWIKPVIELSTNGPVKVIDNQLETIFRSFGLDNNYLRVDISIDSKYSEMSDSNSETLQYLINETKSQVIQNQTLTFKLKMLLNDSGLNIEM